MGDLLFLLKTRERREDRLVPGVRAGKNEPFEKALRRFNRIMEREGILSEIKKHQHFENPSEKRRKKLNQARKRK